MNERNNQRNFIKIKNFCSTSDIVKRVRREATDWEKIILRITSEWAGIQYIQRTPLTPTVRKQTTRSHQRRRSDGKWAHGKMLCITCQQRNTNSNELPQTYQNGRNPEHRPPHMLAGMCSSGSSPHCWWDLPLWKMIWWLLIKLNMHEGEEAGGWGSGAGRGVGRNPQGSGQGGGAYTFCVRHGGFELPGEYLK